MLGLFVFLTLMSALVGLAGKNREIGFWAPFVISLIFTPFIGIIFILFSGRKNSIKRMVENQELQIRQLNSMSTIRTAPVQTQATTSVADELMKLSELLEKGILTQNEYEQQKKKLLDN